MAALLVAWAIVHLLVFLPLQANAVVSVSPSTIHVGTVYTGDDSVCSFTVTNIGDRDLKILKISFSCGCFKVDAPRRLLPPDETAVVTLTLDTSRPRLLGERLCLSTDDRLNPQVFVRVVGQVRPLYAVKPERFLIDMVRSTDQDLGFASVDVVLSPERFRGLEIGEVRSSHPEVVPRFTLYNVNNTCLFVRLSVTIEKMFPLGNISERVRLVTNNPHLPILEIPVEGCVRSDVALSPPMISAGVLPNRSQKSFRLSAKDGSGRSLKIQTVRVEESGSGAQPMRVSIDNGEVVQIEFLETGVVSRNLLVLLDDGRTAALPLRAYVTSPAR